MMSAHFDLMFLSKQPQPVNPKALVVLLHGVGGSDTNLVDLAAAINSETLVVMPRGPITLGAGQYGWFRVNFTAAGPVIVEPHIADKAQLATLRAFIGHGEYDNKLPVIWAQRSDQLLSGLSVAHLTRLYPIEHGISAEMQADFVSWLQSITSGV